MILQNWSFQTVFGKFTSMFEEDQIADKVYVSKLDVDRLVLLEGNKDLLLQNALL